MTFMQQKLCVAASKWVFCSWFVLLCFLNGLHPTVGWELALVQKQSNLLGHTCSPRLFFGRIVCKIDVILPEAVNSLIIHVFHLQWHEQNAVLFIDSTFLTLKRNAVLGDALRKQKIPKSFILFILVFLLVCSVTCRRKSNIYIL